MPDASTPARQIVETEIRAKGPITFARFMEVALYGEQGYYTSSVNAGADYATSPQMHPAFGALIAGYLFRAWQALSEPDTFDVVELGAGDGGLARDMLDAVKNGREFDDLRAQFCAALRYHALDIRPRGSARDVDELRGLQPVVGCVISNELLDAFPAHVFTVREGGVLERYVNLDDDGGLVFVEGEVSDVAIVDRVGEYASILPEGYRGEVNLGIEAWATRVAGLLQSGYVLTIDYGYPRNMLYHPMRYEGSLRCYRDHALGQDPFRDLGLQDMTAHVDFNAVDEELERVGFESMGGLMTQREFLFDLGIGEHLRSVRKALVLGRRDGDVSQWLPVLRALNALVDTRGLGEFRVVQHQRRAPTVDLTGLETSPVFACPRLRPRHLGFIPYD